jgi:putative mRNA 3-end processing factor
MSELLHVTSSGLYCPAGDFYIDPWRPVENAVVTHAHSDHARVGSENYFCSAESLPLLHHRLGKDLTYNSHEYSEQFQLGNAKVSLHSAGHILGSSQVRVEVSGKVWVASGDYKRDPDPTCAPFEVVPCNTFITEATFGLPIYKWIDTHETVGQIYQWWQNCRAKGYTALLLCYALGKSQRVLGELTQYTNDTVYLHGAVDILTQVYRDHGIPMVPTIPVSEVPKSQSLAGELIIAPPSAFRSLWMKRFKNLETGFASGWMRARAGRRQRGYDRGFVLSDHADWPALIQTAQDTGAENILITHGRVDVLMRYLNEEMGLHAQSLKDAHWGEHGNEDDDDASVEVA